MVPRMLDAKESPGISAGASHQVTRLPLSENTRILARAADILEPPVFWGCVALLSNVVALVSIVGGGR